MEVYQSSKTAAEMEYALSAIPSIGANNHWFIGGVDTGILAEGLTPYIGGNQNWWVGETDTGIYAGGVKVEGAEVGQTVVVKAVDENGRPTEWEPADISKKYRFIKHIAIDEEVTAVDFSEDEDGNPFALTDIVLIGYTKGTGSLGQMRINCTDASTDDRYSILPPLTSFRGLDTTARYWTISLKYLGNGKHGYYRDEDFRGLWLNKVSLVDSSFQGYGSATGTSHPKGVFKNTAFEYLTEVTFLRIFSNTSGNNFAAGSYIDLWGR